MLVIGILILFVVLAFLVWLMFSLAVYALPLFVGAFIGTVGFHHGAGLAGAFGLGLLAAGTALVVGQIAFALTRSLALRGIIALLYAIPAGMAGHSAASGLAHIFIASDVWCAAYGALGAVLVGGTAILRIAGLTAPLPAMPADAAASSSPVLDARPVHG